MRRLKRRWSCGRLPGYCAALESRERIRQEARRPPESKQDRTENKVPPHSPSMEEPNEKLLVHQPFVRKLGRWKNHLGGQDPEGIQFPPRKLPDRRVRLLERSFPIWRVADPPGLRPSPSRPSRQRTLLHQVFRERAPKASQDFLAFQLHAICFERGFPASSKPSALLLRERTYSQPSRGVNSEAWESDWLFPPPPLGDKISIVSGFLTKLLPVQLVGGVIVFEA